jgi:hypothetical protein
MIQAINDGQFKITKEPMIKIERALNVFNCKCKVSYVFNLRTGDICEFKIVDGDFSPLRHDIENKKIIFKFHYHSILPMFHYNGASPFDNESDYKAFLIDMTAIVQAYLVDKYDFTINTIMNMDSVRDAIDAALSHVNFGPRAKAKKQYLISDSERNQIARLLCLNQIFMRIMNEPLEFLIETSFVDIDKAFSADGKWLIKGAYNE